MLCDWCDKAFHKECLKEKYREANPVSWFCPDCHALLLASNIRDPYTDHNLLNFLVDPESLTNVSHEEFARVQRLAAFFEVEDEDLYRKGDKGR